MTDSNGPVSQPSRGKKSDAAKSSTSASEHAAQRAGTSGLLDLQRGAGNQAVGGLLTRAATDAGRPLDGALRQSLEQGLRTDLSRVRVHDSAASATAADSIGARAYTIGSDIHLGHDASGLDRSSRDRLLAHEAVHTVQQGGRPAPLAGVMPVSTPGDASESEARSFADALTARPSAVASGAVSQGSVSSGSASSRPASPALALRDSLRATSFAPHIQRDIVGDKTFATGKFEINFKSTNAAAAGDFATEDGTVKFTPAATAAESDSIKYIQVVRNLDTGTNKEFDFAGSDEANRNAMQTTRNNPKNIAPGFFVDQNAGTLKQRTKKADAAVQPFYDVTGPPVAGNVTGKRRGATIVPAVLKDTPGFSGPLKFSFVTVAKASDTGFVYGTVLWGFETFVDGGKAKIKNEYTSFRTFEGETFVDALKRFNEFYKNPGTPGAPAR